MRGRRGIGGVLGQEDVVPYCRTSPAAPRIAGLARLLGEHRPPFILAAVETVAVVINAVSGVEIVARRIMELAKERDLCRAIIINKCDMPDVDLETLLAQVQETFGPECLPINLPSGGGKTVVECLLN